MAALDVGQHVGLIGSGSGRIVFAEDVESARPATRVRRDAPVLLQQSNIRFQGVPVSDKKQTHADWKLSVSFMKRGSMAVFIALVLGSVHEIGCALLLAGAAHRTVSMAQSLRGTALQMEVERAHVRRTMKVINLELEQAMKGLETVKKQLRTRNAEPAVVSDALDQSLEDFEAVSAHLMADKKAGDEDIAHALEEIVENRLRAGKSLPDFVSLEFE